MVKRKCLAISIMLLFIGVSIFPTSGQTRDTTKSTPSTSTTLYVGGSGPGNFTRIQDAIDNASPQDTIIIYPGIYNENLILPIPLHLNGLGGPLVNSSGSSVIITANGCSLENMQFAATRHHCLCLYSSFNTITNCSVLDSFYDLDLTASHSNLISGNTFAGGYSGITLSHSNNNTIENNTLSHQSWEKMMIKDDSSHNLVRGNTLIENDYSEGIINTGGSSNNQYLSNVMSLLEAYGVILYSGTNLTIVNNELAHYGFYLHTSPTDASTYTIKNNTIEGRPITVFIDKKNLSAPADSAQVILFNCSSCSVEDLETSIPNPVSVLNSPYTLLKNLTLETDNGRIGVSISGSHDTILQNSTVTGFSQAIEVHGSNRTFITGNTITRGSEGLWIGSQNSISFKDNLVSDFSYRGFYSDANDLLVEHNIFTRISWYIQISGNNIRLANNTIINNSRSLVLEGNNLQVSGNLFSGNGEGGLECGGIKISITGNTFKSNKGCGLLLGGAHFVSVAENNFIRNDRNAYFQNSWPCRWKKNYWEPSLGIGPKVIPGRTVITLWSPDPWAEPPQLKIPWVQIDWHPAQEPYDIPGMS
jgi:parallel beta-helix repeat protein